MTSLRRKPTQEKKRKKSKRFGDPIPVKLDLPTDKIVHELIGKTSLGQSEVLRRAIRYAAPKFLSGEVNIADVAEIAKTA